MVPTPSRGTLDHLRRAITSIEKNTGFTEDPGTVPLGLPAADNALGGGLARAAVHDVAPAAPAHFGAASGFSFALMALALAREKSRPALVIQTDFGALETGALYGPGLDCFGVGMQRLIVLRVPRPVDVLWAAAEALKSRGVAIVLAELPGAGTAADLVATQRLTLAARAGGGLLLLLRQRPSPLATAVMTAWQVSAAPSTPDRYGGLGQTTFDLSLSRNRHGRCGRFIMCWNHHERVFLPAALSVGVAATAFDGSADPRPLARAG
jgi:protein ImuA